MEGMATHLGAHLASMREDLRFQPVSRRVRASLDGQPVADTAAACLVWEPHRIVPLYAVPVADVSAGLVPVDNVTPPTRCHRSCRRCRCSRSTSPPASRMT